MLCSRRDGSMAVVYETVAVLWTAARCDKSSFLVPEGTQRCLPGLHAPLTVQVLRLSLSLGSVTAVDLRVRYIPSKENPSDYFSREADKGDYAGYARSSIC